MATFEEQLQHVSGFYAEKVWETIEREIACVGAERLRRRIQSILSCAADDVSELYKTGYLPAYIQDWLRNKYHPQERPAERIDLGGTFTVEVVKDRRDSRRVELHSGEDAAVDISVWGPVGDFGKIARGERYRMVLERVAVDAEELQLNKQMEP